MAPKKDKEVVEPEVKGDETLTPDSTSAEKEQKSPEASEAEAAAEGLSDAVAPDERLDIDEEIEDADELEVVEKTAAEETSEKEGEEAEAKVGEEAGEKPAKPAEAKAPEPEARPEEKPEAQPAPEVEKPEGEDATSPPQPDLEAVQKEFTEWREEAVELLSEHHYNFSEDQVKELEEDQVPDVLIKAIPTMMSRVYLDAVTAAMGQITTHLPQLITMVTERQAVASKEEAEFFEKWPALKEHGDTVRRMGVAYRQAHPQVSANKFITEVGASAMVALQLPIEGMGGEPVKPAGNAEGKPFKPAAKGTPAKGPPPRKGAFELLNDEFEEEETLDLE